MDKKAFHAKRASEFSKRSLIWRHNSFLGHAEMMRKQCYGIIASSTTTAESKELAQQISEAAEKLRLSLKERVGP